jgi:NAD(P) transhydrogenase subunit beta
MLGGILIGSVSFSGSMIAYGKLEGKIKDWNFPMQHIVNLSMLAVIIALGVWIMVDSSGALWPVYVLFALSLLYGVMFVLPIGGADMPVVISLLNSFTGVAAAMGGFLYGNQVMLTGGILVGSAGTILTILMCKAMNRSLTNVLIGAFSAKGGGSTDDGEKSHREATPTDVAILCAYAQNVVIVPGYGLAVAQAQHTVHEFEKQLTEKGVNVQYAIHPVAGRMPGHMNVLLAEADVPYEKLIEMEDINPQMPQTDVVLVIGANDVVNPAAEDDPNSPIYGMPIIQAAKAKQTVILKRSMGTGYAGIDNPLFYQPKTQMLLGDAKASLQKLIEEVKGV